MNGKLLAALVCLAVAFVGRSEAASKEEVFGLINQMANEQEVKLTKKLAETVEETMKKAKTDSQRGCIRTQVPAAHRSITDPIDDMWEKLTAEYQKMTPAQIERVKINALTTRLKYKYNYAVSNIDAKLRKIKKCVS